MPEVASDRWAEGLADAPRVEAAQVPAILAGEGRVFVLKRGDYDPGRTLAQISTEQPFHEITGTRQPGLSLWRAR